MIAFVFPGQGSQQVGMGKVLADTFPICHQALAEADAALGWPLSTLGFDGPAETLALTENTQPAVLAVSVAVHRLLVSRGVTPQVVAGHSLGEYSAHVAAGTISFADAIRTVHRRGRYMQDAVPVGTGAMAAVLGLDAETVARACRDVSEGDVVSPANLNAPGQVVIAGSSAAVARAGARARELGARRVTPLPVSAPFHCALMRPAERRLEPVLRRLVVSDPAIPVVANVDGDIKTDAAAAVDALVSQVCAPVQWETVVQRLTAQGVDTFVEVGPGRVLSGLIKRMVRTARVLSVEDPSGLTRLEEQLAGPDPERTQE